MHNDLNHATVNLFWTGGYDSTFRLLQLVLQQGRKVQPYYLIDPKRQSLRLEIKAIREIKNLLYKRYPGVKALILPTIFAEVSDIPPDAEIEQAYQEFTRTHHLESQYTWLARFCKQHHIHDMEVCTQILHNPKKVTSFYYLERVADTPEFRIMEKYLNGPVGTLFGNFRYPKFGIPKLEIKAQSDSAGWADLMALTWFCQSPVKGRYPCGTCHPCTVAINEGLGWRIPWWRRLYAKLGLETLRKWAVKRIRRINPAFHTWQGR